MNKTGAAPSAASSAPRMVTVVVLLPSGEAVSVSYMAYFGGAPCSDYVNLDESDTEDDDDVVVKIE